MISDITIGRHVVGVNKPAYTIAEIGSNFDGDLNRAKALIDLAKKAGAQAAKFQTFRASTIINKNSFSQASSFQAKWKKPVWDVYQAAEFPFEWHKEIKNYCEANGLDFLTSPYDREAVDLCEKLGVCAYKIGSGEITHLDFLSHVASKKKPVILGCGAATMAEIDAAVSVIRKAGCQELILLQCITQYPTPFEEANIRAMVTLGNTFQTLVGYSDHTPGSIVPLGSVALGGIMIEKHFTDDKTRPGPDHPFAMDFKDFKEMVDGIRLLEKALGNGLKEVAACENETVILQRRALFAARPIKKGQTLGADDIAVLRPQKGILPSFKSAVIGQIAREDMAPGDPITWDKI